MRKCELLSPAGNMEMLKYAVLYGADAVYLAGTKFGARKFANNFNEIELIEAVKFAHLYGVKVYVTINTLIYENEVEEFLDYVYFIHSIGVDAVLVQDMGMLKLLHEMYPNLELHASTQMHNNSAEMVQLLKNFGVKRVVLDREMSLDEIKLLPNDMEKEVFCHGALCVSYSGQCLLSSYILNRSGNRGECAGMCRLPYKLCEKGKVSEEPKYYLSLKDLCTVTYINKILEAGVDCLKIEGRMKSPQYVGYMTKIYRKLIDSYYANDFIGITSKEMKNIKILFNRGFTCGFMCNSENKDVSNISNPNHVGVSIGTYNVEGKKVKLLLIDTLVQGDTIRFQNDNKGMTVNFLYNKKGKLINSANNGEVVFVDNFLDLKCNGDLRLVSSVLLNSEIDQLPKRTVDITGEVIIKENRPIELAVSDGINHVLKYGELPSKALNRPITEDDVIKQVNKLGNTVYQFTQLNVNLDDNMFVNIKTLNELRRDAIYELDLLRTNTDFSVKKVDYFNKLNKSSRDYQLDVVVNNQNQLKVALKYADNIFTSNEDLFNMFHNSKIHFKYEEHSKSLNLGKYMISDYGSLANKGPHDVIYSDYMLNVVNSYSVSNLINLGVNTICLSPELTFPKIELLCQKSDAAVLEILVYGNIELMKMKYNPFAGDESYLVDRNKSKYYIKRGKNINYLMSPNPVDLVGEIEKFKALGIKNFRVDFFNENYEECDKILSKIHKKIF